MLLISSIFADSPKLAFYLPTLSPNVRRVVVPASNTPETVLTPLLRDPDPVAVEGIALPRPCTC